MPFSPSCPSCSFSRPCPRRWTRRFIVSLKNCSQLPSRAEWSSTPANYRASAIPLCFWELAAIIPISPAIAKKSLWRRSFLEWIHFLLHVFLLWSFSPIKNASRCHATKDNDAQSPFQLVYLFQVDFVLVPFTLDSTSLHFRRFNTFAVEFQRKVMTANYFVLSCRPFTNSLAFFVLFFFYKPLTDFVRFMMPSSGGQTYLMQFHLQCFYFYPIFVLPYLKLLFSSWLLFGNESCCFAIVVETRPSPFSGTKPPNVKVVGIQLKVWL